TPAPTRSSATSSPSTRWDCEERNEMNFDPTEEQQLLAASIARFVERDYPFDVRRAIVASAAGQSAAIWRTLAELGLLGLTLPEDHGGFGGGAQDAMSLMNAIGEALIIEPWLATVGT